MSDALDRAMSDLCECDETQGGVLRALRVLADEVRRLSAENARPQNTDEPTPRPRRREDRCGLHGARFMRWSGARWKCNKCDPVKGPT